MPEEKTKNERQPYQVRLPGFITDGDVGLGDVFKRVTYAVGIRSCDGCARRAAALNRWLRFHQPSQITQVHNFEGGPPSNKK